MPNQNEPEPIEIPLIVLMADAATQAAWRNEKWLHVLLLSAGNETEAGASLARLSEIERKLNEP